MAVTALFELRRAPWLTLALFGVRPAAGTRQAHWDLATLLLRRVLLARARPGDRVLEVGCGDSGILSVALRLRGVEVVAMDVAEEAVAGALATAAANGVTLDARRSDLLQALRPGESFALVFFNPPFVPTAMGEAASLERDEPRRVWDGGSDGMSVIERFLGQCARLAPTTLVLVGINGRIVDPAELRARAEGSGFRHVRTHRALFNPARVLELRLRT